MLHWLEKNNNFVKFKVHLIHRKRVPLLRRTVLIFCDEGAELVAVLVTVLLPTEIRKLQFFALKNEN